ncbi:MAG: LysR family transcriptional regulator [Clostridiales bacterium]|nr:LysR family transcriptional regulator [Clostridiales bacterium]
MDFQQVRYFVTAAKNLNFSRAADQLYITQPALSRQINSIEKELNIQLFIRNGHELKLTPAAKMLLAEFSQIYDRYEAALEHANAIQHGMTGKLRIGVLDGTRVDDFLPGLLSRFTGDFPEIDIVTQYLNFNDLIYDLYDDLLDISFTLKFEVENRKHIKFKPIMESRDHIAMLDTHPLAEKGFVSFTELENDTFILLDPNVSETGTALILERFKACGFRPNTKYSPSLNATALMVQAGRGIAMLDSRSVFRFLPGVKFLDTDEVSDPTLVAAWHQNNKSTAFLTFKKYL